MFNPREDLIRSGVRLSHGPGCVHVWRGPPRPVSEAGPAELRKHQALVLLPEVSQPECPSGPSRRPLISARISGLENVREVTRLEQDNPWQNLITFIFTLHVFLQLPSIWGL